MRKPYIRWDGFRVKHRGEDNGSSEFVSFGWLCGRDSNSDTDTRVQIFRVANYGYTFKVCP